MKLICKDVKTTDEARFFVLSCERQFEAKLRQATREIISRGNRIITLAGPTCSGKTTTARMLVEEIERTGRNAEVISIDDFYLDNLRVGIADGRKIDFDSVKTIDLNYLAAFVRDLTDGKTVKTPIFNFKTGLRDGYREIVPQENDIYVFEGIQAVYPEVTSILGERYTSVFICVNDDVICNGERFASHEIRLLRRIVRDHLFRSTSPENTLLYWDSVRENEETSIFPNAGGVHFLIDSFLTYELFMIAGFAVPRLREVPKTAAHYAKAKGLADRLEGLRCDLYLSEFVPDGSMFREFIGQK